LRLPNADRARIDRRKITHYLLSSDNPRGRSKAEFFQRFGFRIDRWEALAEALKRQATSHEVSRIVETPYGPRFHVDGAMETPGGRNPWVRTVWQIDLGNDFPRFITAHPRRR